MSKTIVTGGFDVKKFHGENLGSMRGKDLVVACRKQAANVASESEAYSCVQRAKELQVSYANSSKKKKNANVSVVVVSNETAMMLKLDRIEVKPGTLHPFSEPPKMIGPGQNAAFAVVSDPEKDNAPTGTKPTGTKALVSYALMVYSDVKGKWIFCNRSVAFECTTPAGKGASKAKKNGIRDPSVGKKGNLDRNAL